MLSANNSRILAMKIQLAKANRDFDMMNKIEAVKNDEDVTKDMLNYKLRKKPYSFKYYFNKIRTYCK